MLKQRPFRFMLPYLYLQADFVKVKELVRQNISIAHTCRVYHMRTKFHKHSACGQSHSQDMTIWPRQSVVC